MAFTLHSKKANNCKNNLQLECTRVKKEIKKLPYYPQPWQPIFIEKFLMIQKYLLI